MRTSMLATLVKEFLYAQKREIASRLRMIALARNQLSASEDEKAKSLLEAFNTAVEKRQSTAKLVERFSGCLGDFDAWDKTNESIWRLFQPLSDGLQEMIRDDVSDHPLWERWLCSVKGVDFLLAGEVIGGFGWALKPEETIGGHFRSPSQMWAFAGLDVQNGVAPRLAIGVKATHCRPLRSILMGRLAVSLVMAGGEYAGYYRAKKQALEKRCERDGVKIVPSSQLPTKGGKIYEPEGVISKGHLDMMAKRAMVKLFVVHLWEEARRSEGLEAGKGYVFTVLGHSADHYIPPIRDRKERKEGR